jgi:hypothetical protein
VFRNLTAIEHLYDLISDEQHYGTRSGGDARGIPNGISYFWDCCDAEEYNAPGCTTGPHRSYDED